MTDSFRAQGFPPADDKDTPTRFSFLLLPAEIRNKIYRYSLVEDPCAVRIHGLMQPPLTRTNKQIRSEALPMYYGEKRFLLHIPCPSSDEDPNAWPDFIRMFRVFKAGWTGGRGTGSLRFIRDMQFQLSEIIQYDCWQMWVNLEACPGRREVYDFSTKTQDGVRVDECTVAYFWQDLESMRNYFERTIFDDEDLPFNEVYLRRLFSTVLMVASECIEFTKGVEGCVWEGVDQHWCRDE